MRYIHFIPLLLTIFVLNGCLTPQAPPTAEQLAMQQQLFNRLMERAQSAQNPAANQLQQAAPPSNIQQNNELTENEMLAKISEYKAISQPVTITQEKDGFKINGLQYLDPEGEIVSYAFNTKSGDISYLCRTSPESFSIKFTRPFSPNNPVLLALVRREGTMWKVTTTTGRQLAGQSLTLLARGFMIARDTAGFMYEPGVGILNVSLPEGFHIAKFQNGEVQATTSILLERNPVANSNQAGQLIDSFKSFGSSLGINKKEDYALLNYNSGHLTPINIDLLGKEVTVHSECHQTNRFVRGCDKVDFFESLFDKYGQPNGTHYFWRVNWFSSDSGTILVSDEGTKVTVVNVTTGKQAIAFSRVMGVNYILAERTLEDKIKLRAKLGLQEEQIDDLEAFLNSAKDIRNS